MGIKERITEIQGQMGENGTQTRFTIRRTAPISPEDYEQQMHAIDLMVLQQRDLFNELEEVGIVRMLEEVAGEGNVKPLRTREEAEQAIVEVRKNGRANMDKNLERMNAQDRGELWRAEVKRPEVLPDGALDSALKLELTRSGQTYMDSSHWAVVLITYSSDKMLRVYGKNTEYVGKVDDDLNLERLEKGLAYAFTNPSLRSNAQAMLVNRSKNPHLFAEASS